MQQAFYFHQMKALSIEGYLFRIIFRIAVQLLVKKGWKRNLLFFIYVRVSLYNYELRVCRAYINDIIIVVHCNKINGMRAP